MKSSAARSALLGAAVVLIAGFIVANPAQTAARHASKISARLRPALASPRSEPLLVWVYFKDKGTAARKAVPQTVVSARSLQRRTKVRPGRPVDMRDLPVDEGYVEQVRARVQRVRHRTKWFNGLSVVATPAQIEAVAALPCVRSVEPLLRGRRADLDPQLEPASGPPPKPRAPRTQGSIDYGRSAPQIEIMGVDVLHDRGITGEGVLIGHFDTGYRSLTHQSLAKLRIAATFDFVDGDVDPAPPPGSSDSWGNHGVNTLSVLAGYAPGNLVGPAFDADYVLVRTENEASETPFEEDNWARAIEWADSLGIDIATTSLGYLSYDEPHTSWTWEDMDGNTTVITRAADQAVANGIAVFNAAGNSGLPIGSQGNTLNAPADGDSVLAVGGVFADSLRYWNSSVGPSADGRIKPDLMAVGAAVWIAGTGSDTHYGYSSGTSFACPLAAGTAALLLSVHPNVTPLELRAALRETATHANAPDSHYGWGIVNAVGALDRLQLSVERTGWGAVKRRYR